MQQYTNIETGEVVRAEEYTGPTGTIMMNAAVMYVERGDWIITRADGSLTAYQPAAFAQRFAPAT